MRGNCNSKNTLTNNVLQKHLISKSVSTSQ